MRDFLIVGQGIAGSVLARMLEREGKTFHIVDGNQTPSASRVAAGVWNPVVLKRFTKSWLAEETIPMAKEYFEREEAFFGDRFFFETQLVKLLSNEAERTHMEKRWEEMAPFVEEDNTLEAAPGVAAPEGIIRVKCAGYLDVSRFLNHLKDLWITQGKLFNLHFSHADLRKEGEFWHWNNESYKQVVFCEGISALNNPWVKHMPLETTKGEIIEVRIPDLDTTHILNKHIFILPYGNHIYRVGATNAWEFDDLNPTEGGKNELLEKLSIILPGKTIEVVNQSAGGRPTTKDRRPLMGALKESGLYVFNGLGSRGVLLVPYLANCMSKFLLGDENALPKEAMLQRLR